MIYKACFEMDNYATMNLKQYFWGTFEDKFQVLRRYENLSLFSE